MSNWTQKLIDTFTQDKKYKDDLIYIQNIDSFLLYDKTEKYHKLLDERELTKEVYHYFKYSAKKNLSQTLVRDMRWQISMSCLLEIEDIPKDYMAFNDKLLDLNTMDFVEFDKAKIAYHKIHFDAEEIKSKAPVFIKFLDSICVDRKLEPDPEMRRILQEMFGYYIFGGELTGEAFFLLGGGSNGKSVIIDLLVEIIGREYTSAMSIQSLTTDKWKPIELIGKKLNVCGEEQSKYMQLGEFKDILTGGWVDCQRKYGGSFKFRPSAKFLFGTNRLPTLDQIGKHIKRRFKIVKFHRIVDEKDQDKQLLSKLKEELAGIIGWAREGKKRLIANNSTFSDSKNMVDSYKEFEQTVSSSAEFLSEEYTESEEGFISNNALYAHYKEWCIESGRKPMSKNNMGRDLNVVLELDSTKKYCADEGHSMRGRQLINKSYDDDNLQQSELPSMGEGDDSGSQDVIDMVSQT